VKNTEPKDFDKASTILTNIILGRREKTFNENLSGNQFVFRKNKGTREALLYLRIFLKKILQ
jgi:hypothetical protein